jgi:hypothetical protein
VPNSGDTFIRTNPSWPRSGQRSTARNPEVRRSLGRRKGDELALTKKDRAKGGRKSPPPSKAAARKGGKKSGKKKKK